MNDENYIYWEDLNAIDHEIRMLERSKFTDREIYGEKQINKEEGNNHARNNRDY